MLLEPLRKVGEEVGKQLSLAPLRAKNLREHDPWRSSLHEKKSTGDSPRMLQTRELLHKRSTQTGRFRIMGRLSVGTGDSAFLNDVEREAMLQLHARGAENGAQGTRGPSLFPNDLPNVLVGHS